MRWIHGAVPQEQELVTPMGELAALLSALIWACCLCTFRAYAAGISASTLNCFKALVALVCLFVALAVVRPELPTDATTWLLLGASGVVGLAIGDTAFFAALKRLDAQRTSSLQCLSPPLSAVLALVFLDERLTPMQLGGMALTVTAVLGVIWSGRPSRRGLPTEGVAAGVAFAVVAALCQAIGLCLARPALQETDPLAGTLMRFVPTVVVLLAMERLRRPGGVPLRELARDRRRFAILTAAAFAGTFLGIYLLTFATKHAEAGVVAAISHTFPVWVVPVAVVTLKEKAAPAAILWTLVAVAGVAVTLL